jgi:hypothetical protein
MGALDLPFQAFEVTAEPSAGMQIAATGGLPRLPPAGIVVDVQCELSGDEPYSCKVVPEDGVTEAQAQAAEALADAYRLQPRDRAPAAAKLRTRIPIHLTYVPGFEPGTAPAVGLTPDAFTWTKRPDPRDVSRLYPERPLRMAVGGSVQGLCKVVGDLSLACPELHGEPPEHSIAFAIAAGGILERSSVAPLLTDGRSAVGQWVQVTIRFVVP